jgi:hypothetical protein
MPALIVVELASARLFTKQRVARIDDVDESAGGVLQVA